MKDSEGVSGILCWANPSSQQVEYVKVSGLTVLKNSFVYLYNTSCTDGR